MMIPGFVRRVSVASLAMAAAMAVAEPISVTVNGNAVNFNDAQPQMINGRVFVPMRGVFEQMGAVVKWDPESRMVFADGGGRHVQLVIGDYHAFINNRKVTTAVAPVIIEGSTMVPLRFLGEALGAEVDWHPDHDLVALYTHGGNGAAQSLVRSSGDTSERRRGGRMVVIHEDTVIPMRMDVVISSDADKTGDRFTATIEPDQNGHYANFPQGTVVEGYVKMAAAATDVNPGMLDLRFTEIKFPDGSHYPVHGAVARLDDTAVVGTDAGRYVVEGRGLRQLEKDAAIGDGAGLLVDSFDHGTRNGDGLASAIGTIDGRDSDNHPHNVIFGQGMRLALILGRGMSIERRDIQN